MYIGALCASHLLFNKHKHLISFKFTFKYWPLSSEYANYQDDFFFDSRMNVRCSSHTTV